MDKCSCTSRLRKYSCTCNTEFIFNNKVFYFWNQMRRFLTFLTIKWPKILKFMLVLSTWIIIIYATILNYVSEIYLIYSLKNQAEFLPKIVYQLWNSHAIVTVFCFYYCGILELINFQCWVWVWLLINKPGCKYCLELKTLLLIYLFLFYVYEHFAYMHTYLSLFQTPEEGSDALRLELWMVVDSEWATLWPCDPMIF